MVNVQSAWLQPIVHAQAIGHQSAVMHKQLGINVLDMSRHWALAFYLQLGKDRLDVFDALLCAGHASLTLYAIASAMKARYEFKPKFC